MMEMAKRRLPTYFNPDSILLLRQTLFRPIHLLAPTKRHVILSLQIGDLGRQRSNGAVGRGLDGGGVGGTNEMIVSGSSSNGRRRRITASSTGRLTLAEFDGSEEGCTKGGVNKQCWRAQRVWSRERRDVFLFIIGVRKRDDKW